MGIKMGISGIVALSSTAVIGMVGILKGRVANQALLIPLLHASMVGYLTAIIAHPALNLPLLFGKTREGTFPMWAMLVFYPYLLPLRIYVRLRRTVHREDVYTEVSEGLFVGGWPSSASHVPPGSPAVVDCTCELPRHSCVSELPYLCIPTWDTRAPLARDIEVAVCWAKQKRLQGRPIYVHCAFGHGRSVTVMCALLISLGLTEDCKDAERLIKQRRPSIRMNDLQRKSLEIWNHMRSKANQNIDPIKSSILNSEIEDKKTT